MPTPDAATLAGLEQKLEDATRRRTNLTERAEALLLEKRAANVEELTGPDAIRFRAMRRDIADAREIEDGLDERVREYRAELERVGTVPPVLQRAQRTMGSAGRLSPLHCPTEELRRLHDAGMRGEQASYERRFTSADPLLPPELFPFPTAAIHDLRILNRLPGYAITAPSVEYVRHVSTTGAAAPVAEGELKPELTLVVDKLTAAAVKLAGHLALSREILDDWDAFSQYSTSELFKRVTDVENDELLNGDAVATPGSMTGFYKTADILSHDCSADTGANVTVLDSVEAAIAEMRSGSALAVPDLFIVHPLDWSAMRRLKTSYGEFLLAPDPSGSEVNSLWGVETVVTVQNPVGRALLVDTTKFGRVAIRSPLGMRIGFANDDFVRNLVRYVAEERLVLTVERPAAVMVLKNLPALPGGTTTATAKK